MFILSSTRREKPTVWLSLRTENGYFRRFSVHRLGQVALTSSEPTVNLGLPRLVLQCDLLYLPSVDLRAISVVPPPLSAHTRPSSQDLSGRAWLPWTSDTMLSIPTMAQRQNGRWSSSTGCCVCFFSSSCSTFWPKLLLTVWQWDETELVIAI